jgi:mannonate dehydratase
MTESVHTIYGHPNGIRPALRWFDPQDVPIMMIAQVPGVTDVVSSLRHIPNGDVWTVAELLKRKIEIEFKNKVDEPADIGTSERDEFYKNQYRTLLKTGERTGLVWATIESMPFTEAIKNGSEERDVHIANYQQSLRNIGTVNDILKETELQQCNCKTYAIESVIGNFMLVADWTRTGYVLLPDGSKTLEYNHTHFAAFDIFMGRRHQLSNNTPDFDAYQQDGSYSSQEIDAARAYWATSLSNDREHQESLANMIIAGLPGAQASFGPNASLEDKLEIFRKAVSKYEGMTVRQLRENIFYFLDQVVDTAKSADVKLCCHPDDPAYSPFLGTPRAVGDVEGYKILLDHGCGVNLCFGSLTPNESNRDVMLVVKEIADYGLAKGMKIEEIFPHVHLRPIETDGKNFREGQHAAHIEELEKIVYALAFYGWKGVFRPDHAPDPSVLHQMVEDRTGIETPLGSRGYSLPGRAMGAELLIGLFYGAYKEIAARGQSIDTLLEAGLLAEEDRDEAIETSRKAGFEAMRSQNSHIFLSPTLKKPVMV